MDGTQNQIVLKTDVEERHLKAIKRAMRRANIITTEGVDPLPEDVQAALAAAGLEGMTLALAQGTEIGALPGSAAVNFLLQAAARIEKEEQHARALLSVMADAGAAAIEPPAPVASGNVAAPPPVVPPVAAADVVMIDLTREPEVAAPAVAAPVAIVDLTREPEVAAPVIAAPVVAAEVVMIDLSLDQD